MGGSQKGNKYPHDGRIGGEGRGAAPKKQKKSNDRDTQHSARGSVTSQERRRPQGWGSGESEVGVDFSQGGRLSAGITLRLSSSEARRRWTAVTGLQLATWVTGRARSRSKVLRNREKGGQYGLAIVRHY